MSFKERMNMIKTIIITVSSLFIFQGCIDYKDDPLCSEYKYVPFDKLEQTIGVEGAKKIIKSGNIYIYEDLLLISEVDEGIHIIDNHNKENPISKLFIRIPGNINMAVKDGYLYVDNYMDLVVIDIRDLDNIKEIKRKKNLFEFNSYQMLDIAYSSYFYEDECGFDIDNGVLIKVQK